MMIPKTQAQKNCLNQSFPMVLLVWYCDLLKQQKKVCQETDFLNLWARFGQNNSNDRLKNFESDNLNWGSEVSNKYKNTVYGASLSQANRFGILTK